MKLLIAWLFGFLYLKKLYQKNYNNSELRNNFWNKTLELFNIKYSILYTEKIPETGPVIIVCNHPFGLVDGLIIADTISKKRKDYRILINDEISQVDLIRPYLFPLKLDEKRESVKFNLKSKNDAIQHVQSGGALIIFPSGEVATKEKIFGKVIEKKWQSILGAIIRKTEATICPIYFNGENSFMFHVLGIIYYPLRRILFARELINKKNKFFKAVCLPTHHSSQFIGKGNSEISMELREYTLKGKQSFNN